jgi:hypothetical protein
MTLTLRVESTRETFTVRLGIEDAAPRDVPAPRGYTGNMYRPTALTIEYARSDGDPWALQRWEVVGPKLRQDGSDGRQPAREYGWRLDSAPNFVAGAIAEHLPAVTA